MNFELARITHSPKNDSKRPLAVVIVTPPDEPPCDITDPIERIYRVGMSARSLRSFNGFREAMADELGLWLDDPLEVRAPARREEWNSIVSDAFNRGKGGNDDNHPL